MNKKQFSLAVNENTLHQAMRNKTMMLHVGNRKALWH